MEQAPKPKAGWYPHPSMAETQRYWDGDEWTAHVAPAGSTPPVTNPDDTKGTDQLYWAGVVLSFVFPIGGFICGCALLSRRPSKAVGIMIVSVVSFFIWYAVLTSGSDGPY